MNRGELHSVDAQEYFKAPGISATALEKLRLSPAHFQAYMNGELTEDSDALQLGTLCHRAIFEPDTLTEDSVCFQPETVWIETDRAKKLKSAVPVLTEAGCEKTDGNRTEVYWNGQISECRDWLRDNANGRPIVDAREWKKAIRIRDNAHHDSTVRALLSGGASEQSLLVEDDHGTLRKSRYDYITPRGNVIPDLKTCRSAHPDKFERAIQDRQYFQRAAFYIDNANLAGLSKDTFVFICVETAPPYLVACYQLNDLVLSAGRMIYQRDLQTYRNCVESGRWPGYHQGVREIGLPDFAMRQLEEIL
jgi:hypothetical protein